MGRLVRPAYLFLLWSPDLLPSLACAQRDWHHDVFLCRAWETLKPGG